MAVTTTQRLTMKFKDNQGNDFSIGLSKVKDLTNSAGKTLVNTAMDAMLTSQPYTKELAVKTGAYQTKTIQTDIEMTQD